MLSTRGTDWAKGNFLHGEQNAYDPIQNPNGIVDFTSSENSLMHADLTKFINTHNHFDEQCCAYGEGYTGTLRLRKAMAEHLNVHFQPVQAINPEGITFAAGVTDLNEVCALVTCNPGYDSIMLGMPIYGAFSRDLVMRTGVNLEYVPVGDTDQFSPACIAAYDAGFEAAKVRGSSVKALIICNPHNPLGQCYPRETLVGLLRLCATKGIHLISDEIYALSVCNRDDCPSEKFTSIRAIDLSGIIDPRQVHVLYGMSKDFGTAGLRFGCVISHNREFSKAARAICRFSSPSQFSMALAANLLEDQEFVLQFIQKSRRLLLHNRLLAEDLLTSAGINYHQKGNAGLFLWLDLTPFLPLDEANRHRWTAERILFERLKQAGIKK